MPTKPDFIFLWDLYCGVCAIHIAHRDHNEKLKEKLIALYKGKTPGKGTLPYSSRLSTDDIQCGGCNSAHKNGSRMMKPAIIASITVIKSSEALSDAINARLPWIWIDSKKNIAGEKNLSMRFQPSTAMNARNLQ